MVERSFKVMVYFYNSDEDLICVTGPYDNEYSEPPLESEVSDDIINSISKYKSQTGYNGGILRPHAVVQSIFEYYGDI